MTEKKAKTDAAGKKAKKKKAPGGGKDSNPAKVRQDVSKIVKAKAVQMAKAVIGKTEKGILPKDIGLATVKYLFEVAAIYPPQADQDRATEEEDSLAKTLLRRMNIPEEPVRQDDEDEAETVLETVSQVEPDADVSGEKAEPK